MRNQRGWRQIIALSLCLFIVFSLAFIALGASHACGDKACRTCSVLQACRALLGSISYVFILAGLLYFGEQGTFNFVRKATTHKAAFTLVSLKVKLSN